MGVRKIVSSYTIGERFICGINSKLRVIPIQWNLKNNSDYAKIRIIRKECIGFAQLDQNICSDYAEFTEPHTQSAGFPQSTEGLRTSSLLLEKKGNEREKVIKQVCITHFES